MGCNFILIIVTLTLHLSQGDLEMKLFEYMEELRISSRTLAKEVCLAHTTIERWMKGEVPKTLVAAYLIEVATEGKVTIKDLVQYCLEQDMFSDEKSKLDKMNTKYKKKHGYRYGEKKLS